MALRASSPSRMDSSRQIGRAQGLLELDVVQDVVPGQGLLDHQEVEIVQGLQVIQVGQAVGGVGVAHEQDLGEAPSDFPHHGHVPPGLDLHLDSLVAGQQLCLDLVEQLAGALLNADGDPAIQRPALPPEQLVEGLSLQAA